MICLPRKKINSLQLTVLTEKVIIKRGSYRGGGGGGGGGLWHDSRTKKITNHGSRILKFHFPEITKISTLLSCSYATNSVGRNQN